MCLRRSSIFPIPVIPAVNVLTQAIFTAILYTHSHKLQVTLLHSYVKNANLSLVKSSCYSFRMLVISASPLSCDIPLGRVNLDLAVVFCFSQRAVVVKTMANVRLGPRVLGAREPGSLLDWDDWVGRWDERGARGGLGATAGAGDCGSASAVPALTRRPENVETTSRSLHVFCEDRTTT